MAADPRLRPHGHWDQHSNPWFAKLNGISHQLLGRKKWYENGLRQQAKDTTEITAR
jgi:hypothetical protein